MAEEEVVFSTNIKYKGIFNFNKLYKFCNKWLKDSGYAIFEEKAYEETKKPGKEKKSRIDWKCTKKITDYFKYELGVDFHPDVEKIKAKRGRKKKDMDKGVVSIGIKGKLIYDYEGEWEGSILKFLRGIYDYFIIRGKVSRYKQKLKKECLELARQVKGFLAII
jgi:hypothetical protein